MKNFFSQNKNNFLKNNLLKFYSTFFLLLFSFILNLNFSFAENASNGSCTGNVCTGDFKNFANNLTADVIATLGTMFMAAAFMFFFYGVALYILDRANNKNGDELKKANDFMLWGLIGLFVMVSAWGIIKMAQSLLGDNFASSNQVSIQAVRFQTVPNVGGGDNTSTGIGKDPRQIPIGVGQPARDSFCIYRGLPGNKDQFGNCIVNRNTSTTTSIGTGLDPR